MQLVSEPGDIRLEALLIGTVMAILLLRRQRVEALFVLATASAIVFRSSESACQPPASTLVCGESVSLLLVCRPVHFPSGHVVFYVVFFGFIAFLAWSLLTGYRRWVVIAACGLLIVLIAPSRVYLGAHWASDVIGEYVIGMLWLIMIILRVTDGEETVPGRITRWLGINKS